MQRGQHRRKAATNHCAYNAEGAASVVCEGEGENIGVGCDGWVKISVWGVKRRVKISVWGVKGKVKQQVWCEGEENTLSKSSNDFHHGSQPAFCVSRSFLGTGNIKFKNIPYQMYFTSNTHILIGRLVYFISNPPFLLVSSGHANLRTNQNPSSHKGRGVCARP